MSNPSRRVPQVMAVTLLIGLVTCFPLMAALLLFATDINKVAESPLPSMELIRQAYVGLHINNISGGSPN